MRDAFRSSPPTVYEMRGSVERTAFVRAWLCLPAHARVCLDFLSYILAYCLVSGSAYLAGLPHSLGPLVLSHASLIVRLVLCYITLIFVDLAYSYLVCA